MATKGIWRMFRHGGVMGTTWDIETDDAVVGYVHDESDAHLVTSSKVLLGATKELLHQMKEMLAYYGTPESAVNAAKAADAAIAQAEGR